MTTRLFSNDNYFIDERLKGWCASQAMPHISGLGKIEFGESTDDELADQVLERVWRPPVLGELTILKPMAGASTYEAVSSEIAENAYTEHRSARIPLRWAISGIGEWLRLRPRSVMVPAERYQDEESEGVDQWATERNRLKQQELADELFKLANDESHILSFVDLPHSLEATQVASERDRMIDLRSNELSELVDAVVAEATELRSAIRLSIKDSIEERRRSIEWGAALVDGLEFPEPVRPKLEVGEPAEPSPKEVSLPEVLASPSFEQILRTIDAWREKIEQYPKTFSNLTEDDLSNLLAVSLACAYGIAEREVFTVGGRSDVRIPVAAVYRLKGLTPPDTEDSAFVAEAKRDSGENLADQAKNQLDGYLPEGTRRAALIFYVNGVNHVARKQGILDGLRGRPDYLNDCLADEYDVPFEILRFSAGESVLEVAVVYVRLPPEDITDQR